jgi:ABC-type branched-subunit amino acid transport system substrate-binding protein
MNKKIIWGIVIIIIIIVVAILASRTPSTDQPAPVGQAQVIKIGVIGPMTGGAAVYGTNLAKGAQLALTSIGTTKNTYQLVFEDDGTNPAQAASAAQKLVNVEKVQALLTVTSGTGNAVKPIAANAKIPQICLCSDTRVADGAYNFTNILMADDETRTWLNEAKARGVKTIAVLGQNQPGFNLLLQALRDQATSTGITIVYDERIEPSIKDFKTSIAKARATKPDLFLIGFFPPQLDIIGQELKTLGVTNIAGVATFSIGADPALFNGRWYSDASLSSPAFADEFIKAFPDTRFNVRVAPYAFDSFNLLVNGFESGDVLGYLLGVTSYPGKAGNLTKAKSSSSFRAPIGIWEIKDGKPVQLK